MTDVLRETQVGVHKVEDFLHECENEMWRLETALETLESEGADPIDIQRLEQQIEDLIAEFPEGLSRAETEGALMRANAAEALATRDSATGQIAMEENLPFRYVEEKTRGTVGEEFPAEWTLTVENRAPFSVQKTYITAKQPVLAEGYKALIEDAAVADTYENSLKEDYTFDERRKIGVFALGESDFARVAERWRAEADSAKRSGFFARLFGS